MILNFIAILHCFRWWAHSLLGLLGRLIDILFLFGLEMHIFIELVNILVLRHLLRQTKLPILLLLLPELPYGRIPLKIKLDHILQPQVSILNGLPGIALHDLYKRPDKLKSTEPAPDGRPLLKRGMFSHILKREEIEQSLILLLSAVIHYVSLEQLLQLYLVGILD
jgi:hypothetical protein